MPTERSPQPKKSRFGQKKNSVKKQQNLPSQMKRKINWKEDDHCTDSESSVQVRVQVTKQTDLSSFGESEDVKEEKKPTDSSFDDEKPVRDD